MELKKANLHMDQIKCQANVQMTLEEDKNISDRNPDAVSILMEKGNVLVEEVRPGKDTVSTKGKMVYEVIYVSDEEPGRLYRIQGEIPWEEMIRVEGMEATDSPRIKVTIEDIRSGLINSRKMNLRALLNFCVEAKEIRDEEVLLEITDANGVEVKREMYEQAVLVMDKKDIFRIREEAELPSTLPPIREVLWKYLDLEKWEIRTLEDKIGIQGELNLFLLYEAQGEGGLIKAYETKIPFSGNMECPGSNGCMVADITPEVSSWSINVKTDYDGEERLLEMEMVLDIPIQLYENREMEMITDVYGVGQNIIADYTNGCRKAFQEKHQGKVRVADTISVSASGGNIVQICHIEVNPVIDNSRVEEDGLVIEGIAGVNVLYMTDKEEKPYEVLKRDIPFSYTLENNSLTKESQWKINVMLDQCNGIILAEDKMEVKFTIALEILIFDCCKALRIKNIRTEPFSVQQMEEVPGIMVYIPAKKEELWNIGKKYGISLESIKSTNQITRQEVEKGQKILLVRDLS